MTRIIEYIADGSILFNDFDKSANDKTNTYRVVGNGLGKTAAEIGYSPGVPYPDWIIEYCPNAPDATDDEIRNLFNNSIYFENILI